MTQETEKAHDDAPLSKLRNFKPIMYPIKNSNDEITGYDYGLDIDSIESIFPWMIQKDNLGRKFLNKDSLIYFLIACLLEQDRDINVLYKIVKNKNSLDGWDPDKN